MKVRDTPATSRAPDRYCKGTSMTEMGTDSPAWSYRGATGPENWSCLSESFKTCEDGLRQSPIDITGYESIAGERIEFFYDSVPIAVINNGRAISVWYEPGSSIAANGGMFRLTTAHCHAPSEHLIDGRRFSAEMHLVHENDEDELAVVAVLLELGNTNPVIEGLLASADSAKDPYEVHPSLHSCFLIPSNRGHFRYVGSTTTPPCLEPVAWFVMAETVTVSEDQVIALQAASHGPNNRAVQPINGRTVRRVN